MFHTLTEAIFFYGLVAARRQPSWCSAAGRRP
jgi:hypothetical protein